VSSTKIKSTDLGQMQMQKRQKGHYFDDSQSEALDDKEGAKKGRTRKEIEEENRESKREEKIAREKERIKRQIRKEHIVNHKEGDYNNAQPWDRESKLAVYSILALKAVLIVFVMVEIYFLLIHQTSYFF
jgi:hypothetical protein